MRRAQRALRCALESNGSWTHLGGTVQHCPDGCLSLHQVGHTRRGEVRLECHIECHHGQQGSHVRGLGATALPSKARQVPSEQLDKDQGVEGGGEGGAWEWSHVGEGEDAATVQVMGVRKRCAVE